MVPHLEQKQAQELERELDQDLEGWDLELDQELDRERAVIPLAACHGVPLKVLLPGIPNGMIITVWYGQKLKHNGPSLKTSRKGRRN